MNPTIQLLMNSINASGLMHEDGNCSHLSQYDCPYLVYKWYGPSEAGLAQNAMKEILDAASKANACAVVWRCRPHFEHENDGTKIYMRLHFRTADTPRKPQTIPCKDVA